MNVIEKMGIMREIEKFFDEFKTIERQVIEYKTGLSEKSIGRAYYLETGDVLIKLNAYGIPAACSCYPHTHYIRVKDMSAEQILMYDPWLKSHKEGTISEDDIVLKQLDDRKNELLGGL